MFKTIVLALDGSEGSRQAMPVAVDLARRDKARLVVVHVEEEIIGKGGGPLHATEDEIQAEIRREAQNLSESGVETRVEMRSVMLGGPAHALEDVAAEVGADLIVAGTRGHTAAAGILLGSVTHRLLHIARRPVLVVPSGS